MTLIQRQIEFIVGAPSDSEGSNGDIVLSYIRGKGLYLCVKYNNKWKARLMLDSFETLQEEITRTVTEIDISGIIDHDNLSNVTSNQHHNAVTAGDGIDLTGQQVAVDVTDILGTGLSETANDIDVVYGVAGEMNDIDLSANSAGVVDKAARVDHKHDLDESISPTWTSDHTWATNSKIYFRDLGIYIYSDVDGSLSIVADGQVKIPSDIWVNAPYGTSLGYTIISKPQSGLHFFSGNADYDQNYSILSEYSLQSSNYDNWSWAP